MKVRHFGLPPTSLLGRTPAVAPGEVTEGGGTQISKTGDVGLEGGALTFPRGAEELSAKAKAERGRVLLETLRVDGGGAFGGKVKGGVDVGASLRAYLRSLEVAQVATERGATAAVTEFVDGLDVPEDIRPLLGLAVDSHEIPAALGTLKQHENDANTNPMWQRWQHGDAAVHTVTDETVRKWFTQWRAGNDMNGYLNYGDPNFKVGVFRFFARAKELGINVVANNYAGYLAQLPATDDTAKTLHRFARAFGIDPATINLGNRPLSGWSGAGRAARAVHGSPLGREAKWLNKAAEWQQAFARGDVSTLKINDASLRVIVAANLLRDPHSFVYGAPAQMKNGGLLLVARAKELGLNVPVDINVLTNLATHAPGSVENARAITRLGRAVHLDAGHLALGGKPVAEWLGASRAPPPGRKGALGTTATWEGQPNYNALYAAAQQQPASVRSITDATLVKWFGAWGPNKDLPAYHGTGNPESRVSFALWWARAKEIGLPGSCNPASMQQYANTLPETADAANALRRLGAAFGFSPEQLMLAGRTPVSTYPRRGYAAAALTLPARPVLGANRFTATQLEGAFVEGDPKLFTVDDATLKRILEKHPGLATFQQMNADRAWQLGALNLAERSLAFDGITPAQAQELIRAVPYKLLDDDVVCERLATLACRAGLAAGAVALSNGTMLAAHATTKPHVEKLDRILEGTSAAVPARRPAKLDEVGGLAAAGPLGDTAGPHTTYWNQKNVAFLSASDDALRAEFMGWGDFNSWLPHWNNDPRLISFVARIAELNDGNPAAASVVATKAWLGQQPVPEIFGTADALPRVLRAARAAGVDPATVNVLSGGKPVPLLEHPALAPLLEGSAADVAEREAALKADLAMLDASSKDGAKRHAAEREGAVLRLLSVTDPEHEIIHGLDELLAAGLKALSDGKLERVDLRGVPEKHRARLLETAFARDEHPAVIALLAGVFFHVDASAIEALLLEKGHLPSVAKEMGAMAASLQERSAADIAFAAIGAGKDPPSSKRSGCARGSSRARPQAAPLPRRSPSACTRPTPTRKRSASRCSSSRPRGPPRRSEKRR